MNPSSQLIHKLLTGTPYDGKVMTVFASNDISASELVEQVASEGKKFQLFNISDGVVKFPKELPLLLDGLIEKGYVIIFNVREPKDLDALTTVLGQWKTVPFAPSKSTIGVTGQVFVHINEIERGQISDDFIRLIDYWGSGQPETIHE